MIVEVVAAERYSDLEARIRALGFSHDMQEGARPMALKKRLKVDASSAGSGVVMKGPGKECEFVCMD